MLLINSDSPPFGPEESWQSLKDSRKGCKYTLHILHSFFLTCLPLGGLLSFDVAVPTKNYAIMGTGSHGTITSWAKLVLKAGILIIGLCPTERSRK